MWITGYWSCVHQLIKDNRKIDVQLLKPFMVSVPASV